jgi:hypothetical protein
MERLSIQSFLANGHPYHLYVYDSVDGVPEGAVLKAAAEILPREAIFKYWEHDSYAGFSNNFSYKLLLERGGYWADCDMVCLRPLDSTSPYVFSSERSPEGPPLVNHGMLKVPAGSEMMRRAYEIAASKDITTLEWGQTGPRLITQLVEELDLQRYVAHPSVFCPIDYWRWSDVIGGQSLKRLRARLRISRRTRAVHLWNEMWRRHDADKDRQYHPRSLYEALKRRYLV